MMLPVAPRREKRGRAQKRNGRLAPDGETDGLGRFRWKLKLCVKTKDLLKIRVLVTLSSRGTLFSPFVR